MPADLIDVITKAVENVENPPEDTQEDSSEVEESTDESSTEGESTSEETTEEESTTEEPDKTKVVEPDETDKMLAELGVKAPKAGERENKLPHKRVKRIVQNAIKKALADAQAGFDTKLKEFDPFKAKATQWDTIERMVEQDPDNYIRRLAIANPKAFSKFAKILDQQLEEAKEKPIDVGEEPKPDIEYENGARGFSPDQWAKREAWLRNSAVLEAEARISKKFEDRLSPYEQSAKQAAIRESATKTVNAQMAWATNQFGELFTNKANQDEINRYIRSNPGVTFQAACISVLMPKIQQSEDQKRAAILKELNERKKAAKKPVGSSQSKVVDTKAPGERTTEEVILESLRKSGLYKD